jgi:hypothetical protein
LNKYLDGLPENKQKRQFVAACSDSSIPVTPQSILDSFKKIEANQSKKSMLSKVIKRVVKALIDYDSIIGILGKVFILAGLRPQADFPGYVASVDPTPTAIIWGALSVVIKVLSTSGSSRTELTTHTPREHSGIMSSSRPSRTS